MRSETSKLGGWAAIALAAATVVGVGLVAAACSNSGEGEPCNYLASNNGDDDCQDGLICYQAMMLNNAGTDLCCPPDRAQATTAACAIPASAPGVDSGIPETGPSNDGSTEPDGDASQADGQAAETSTGDGGSSDGAEGDGALPDGDDGG